MIRVLLVDDDARLLQAWTRVFGAQTDIELVGTRTGPEGLDQCLAALTPDQVVIDLCMGGADPLECMHQLAQTFPDVRFVVHSGVGDSDSVQRAFEAGAWAFVDKLAAPTALLDVLRRVARGEVVFPSHTEPRRAAGA